MNILIIEDDAEIAQLLKLLLEKEGFFCRLCGDGYAALDAVQAEPPDLMILDLMIPGLDGLEVCARVRQQSGPKDPYILMLTAKGEEVDRIIGLSTGADDYMQKPFSPKELVLRVKAIIKRRASTPATTVFSYGPFIFDKNNLAFYLDEEPVSLTSTEFKLLLYLCQRSGQAQDRHELLRAIWGYSDDAHSRTLDTHMKRLRQKLGDSGSLIETVRGIGYLVADI